MNRNNKRYVTEVNYDAEISRFTLIGLNGVTVYEEIRDVSERGWSRFDEEKNLFLVQNMKCLVVKFPMKINQTDFLHYERYTDSINQVDNGYELVMIHASAFSRPILNDLERKGYIKRIWKSYSSENGVCPIYINPKGWQIAYNIASEVMTAIFQQKLKILRNREGIASAKNKSFYEQKK